MQRRKLIAVLVAAGSLLVGALSSTPATAAAQTPLAIEAFSFASDGSVLVNGTPTSAATSGGSINATAGTSSGTSFLAIAEGSPGFQFTTAASSTNADTSNSMRRWVAIGNAARIEWSAAPVAGVEYNVFVDDALVGTTTNNWYLIKNLYPGGMFQVTVDAARDDPNTDATSNDTSEDPSYTGDRSHQTGFNIGLLVETPGVAGQNLNRIEPASTDSQNTAAVSPSAWIASKPRITKIDFNYRTFAPDKFITGLLLHACTISEPAFLWAPYLMETIAHSLGPTRQALPKRQSL